ncbi:ferredoxin--NADP reductase [Magnetofaba australis]|uniref:ferredoxin--NADP(+) reductase n=1 Tax=Magnetofaba australis IT-1 TaxID=1434232 RepID=A0A1Y2K735_9PROT|nr:ferredoxin--NADP reductase [Magnetofaba australis]OSM06149.1 putative oxidoreductase FAD/NAD(P)-binding subunit [Magnetofaba australis IT-1]
MAASKEYNATLVQRVDITPHLAIFRVKPDDGDFAFTAGQFAVLGMKYNAPRAADSDEEEPVDEAKAERLIRRAYSISSGSHENEFLEFYISMVQSGQLTPRLFALQPGDRLWLGPKASGMFTLDQTPPGKSILMIATGTGLAPYISMVRTMAMGVGCPASQLAIVHGASYSWDLGYRNELQSLAEKCPNFHYAPIISRPEKDPDWSGRTGRLNTWFEDPEKLREVAQLPLDPSQTHIFLCGNPGMVESAEAVFTQQYGYVKSSAKESGSLHLEKYW